MRFRNLIPAVISILLVHPVIPAQQAVAALDRNDPELRAILSEIESDIEKDRIENKIAGLSVAIVYDQDVLLSKGFGFANVDKKVPADSATVYLVARLRSSSRR
jgi:CubicO group peptidase (beta-lactamase class C family)